MESVSAFLTALNALSPLAVIALLALVIFYQVKHKDKLAKIETNDLHGLPEILETLQRIEVKLGEEFAHIKARLNGGQH